MSLFTNGRFQAFDAAGIPVPGGTLYTYLTNTTTPQATYTDATLGTPNTNPVVLNSRGEAQVWLGTGIYSMTLKDASGVTVWTVDGYQDPAAAVTTSLAGTTNTTGAGIVGFDWAALYAAATSGWGTRTSANAVNVLRYINPANWGPYLAGTATAPIDTYIQAAITAGNIHLYFPPGKWPFGTIAPGSNVTLSGVRNASILFQIQPGTNIQTGFYKAAGGGSITNFHVHHLTFDGGRVASPASLSNHIFQFDCGAGESVTNISFQHVDFKNAQEDCVRVIASSSTSGVSSKIVVKDCTGITETGSLFEGTNKTFCDLLRVEQTWDYATSGSGYPTFTNGTYVFFKHIEVTGCYTEQIRTCADLKRGCEFFVIANNRTKNMYDCHHSVDGSAHGIVTGNTCEVESTATIASTWTNFIEVQGEHIVISSNTGNGGGLIVNGIMVTDYGRVEEGSNRGHQSVCVIQRDNTVRNVTTNGMRLINGIGCSIEGGVVDTCGAHVATAESGTGRNAADGVTPLVGHGQFIGGVQSRSAATGVTMGAAGIGCRYAPCPDENGEDFYDVPTTPSPTGLMVAAATVSDFYNDQLPQNLCANPFLTFAGAALTFFSNTLTSLASAGPPNGAPAATTMEDNSGAGILTAAYSATPFASVNQRFYINVQAKFNTATKWSVQVDEINAGGGTIASYFYGIVNFNVSGTNWADYACRHTVVSSNCIKLKISVNPAASFAGDGASVGKTDFSYMRISRIANGVV